MKMRDICYFYSFVFSKSGIVGTKEYFDEDAFLEYVQRLNTTHVVSAQNDPALCCFSSFSLSSRYLRDMLNSFFSEWGDDFDSGDTRMQMFGLVAYNQYVSSGMLVTDISYEMVCDRIQKAQDRILQFCCACSAELGVEFLSVPDETLLDLVEEVFGAVSAGDALDEGVFSDCECPFVLMLCTLWVSSLRYILQARISVA